MKKTITLKNFIKSLLIVASLLIIHTVSAQKFVTTTGAGNMDGTTWSDAYDDAGFRAALRNASAGDVFWVAKGTYKPDNVRDSSFRVPNGVKIYGGFSATDTTWVSRKWNKNGTVLSGDIGTVNKQADNCYHVVLLEGTDTSTVIDGFAIAQGDANGAGAGQSNGGGIYNNGSGSGNRSSVTVNNCYITQNWARNDGGGMMDNGSLDGNVASIVTNCVFEDNIAGNGGGLYSAGYNGNNTGTANTLAINCIFLNNSCGSLGGAGHAHTNNGTVRYINCTFYKNQATGGSGSAFYQYKGNANFLNCIVYGNPNTDLSKSANNATLNVYNSLVEGGYTGGTNIINAIPKFYDSTSLAGPDAMLGTADDGFQIVEGSPAINYGLNDSIPSDISTDLISNPRIVYNTADLGAYESPYGCTTVGITTTQTTLCRGNALTFKVHSNFSGANPKYLWKINGQSTNGKDSIFTTSSISSNNTVVTCCITSSQACSYPNYATSNGIKLSVQTSPIVYIAGNTCLGSTLTVSGITNASTITWMKGNTPIYNSIRQRVGNGTTEAGDSSGSTGVDSSLLNGPNAIYIDATNNIYVSDALNHRVQKWAKGSTYGETVAGDANGSSGNDSTKLNTPAGIFVDNIGNVYVADGLNHRVQKWAPGASYGITVAGNGSPGTDSTSLYAPTSVFVDDSSYIYVSDYMNNRVQKWAQGVNYGTTVAGTANGNSGTDSTTLSGPIGLFVDSALNIYVADSKNNRVQKWARNATFGTTLAGDKNGASGSDSSKLNTPTGIYIDAIDNLYIADRFNHRIMKYMLSKNYGFNVAGDNNSNSGSSASYLNQPTGVYTDANADVYVSDAGNNRIQKWKQRILDSTFTPSSNGTYNAVVQTTAGCSGSSTNITILNNVTPTINISASQTTVCAGTAILYQAATTFGGTNPTFKWMKNGNAVGSNDSTYTDINPTNNDSIYCILTSNTQCATPTKTNSNITNITVLALPNAAITTNSNAMSYCKGDSLALYATAGGTKYSWYLNNTLLGSSTDSILYAKNGGDYTLVMSNGNCEDTSAAVTITELAVPSAQINPAINQTFCQGDSIILHASSNANYSYQWFDGTTLIAGATDSLYVAKTSGDYKIKTSNGICSSTSVAVAVKVNAFPSNNISPNTNQTICAGDSIIFQATTGSNYTYQWYNGSNAVANSNNALFTTKTAGSYHYTVSSNGCNATSNAVTVVINPLPNVPLITRVGPDLTSTNAVTYQWFLNGIAIQGATAQNYNTNNQNGKYTVQITDANGCKNTSAELSFVNINNVVEPISTSIQPNPTSGIFTINCSAVDVNANIIIYDMTGREVMKKNLLTQQNFNISDQPNGVYMIKVLYENSIINLKLVKE